MQKTARDSRTNKEEKDLDLNPDAIVSKYF